VKYAPADTNPLPKPPDCPDTSAADGDLHAAIDGLDAEPAPSAGAVASCWDAYVSTVMDKVDGSGDPVATAKALLALADRPHRAPRARDTALRLRHQVGLDRKGAVDNGVLAVALPAKVRQDRAARATVFAGLLRAATMEQTRAAEVPRLFAWIAVQRDLAGGYGSTSATRAVVRAVLAASPPDVTRAKVVAKVAIDGKERSLDVPRGGLAALVVPMEAKELTVDARDVVVRLERPGLRVWARPPTDDVATDLHAEITWPEARAGKTGLLRIVLRADRAEPVDVRVPLPPGVTLAEAVPGVRSVQGVLAVRHAVDGSGVRTVIEVPVRFGLAGKVTVPEAIARYAAGSSPRTVVGAQTLAIAPP
jgi:hypothetical protein